MPDTLYINGSCKIAKGRAWMDDVIVFQQDEATPAAFFPALYKALQLNYPKWYKMDRLSQLGILATGILNKHSPSTNDVKAVKTAIVLANSHSSLDTDIRFTKQLDEIPSPAVFVYTLPNIVIGEISIKYGIKGEQAFFIMDKPDLEFLQQYITTLFAEGQTEQCIVGWIDLFRDHYEAVLFLISNSPEHIPGKILDTKNLYEYLYHEQGAVN